MQRLYLINNVFGMKLDVALIQFYATNQNREERQVKKMSGAKSISDIPWYLSERHGEEEEEDG